MKRVGRESMSHRAGRAVLAGLMVMLVAAGTAAAQQPVPERDPAPDDRRHTVRKGDTLWDLAQQYLANPFLWPLIHEANRRDIRDPHWIYPLQVFRIPGVPADRTFAGPAGGSRTRQSSASAASELGPLIPTSRTRFYYGGPVRRTMTTAEILAAEALEHMRVSAWEHHAAPWLTERRATQVVGQVKPVQDLLPSVGARADGLRPFQEVFIRHHRQRPLVEGEQLLLVREGRRVPGWGRVVEPTAVVRVEEVHTDGGTATVVRQFGRAGLGDLALPLTPFPGVDAPAIEPVIDGPRGRVLTMVEDRQVHRVADHAFIDIGRAHGLRIGDELTVYMPERRSASNRLPAERVAMVRVVRVADQHATVRVLDVQHPVLGAGLPVQLVRTAP